MSAKDNFRVGDRVSFRRSHDKALQLQGIVRRIHADDDDCMDVETIPDGRVVEVATLESVNAADTVHIDVDAPIPGPVPVPVPKPVV